MMDNDADNNAATLSTDDNADDNAANQTTGNDADNNDTAADVDAVMQTPW